MEKKIKEFEEQILSLESTVNTLVGELENIKEYKNVRVSDVYKRPIEDETRITYTSGIEPVTYKKAETELDRIEKKVDRILSLLEGQELSTSFENTRVTSVSTESIYKPIRATSF